MNRYLDIRQGARELLLAGMANTALTNVGDSELDRKIPALNVVSLIIFVQLMVHVARPSSAFEVLSVW